MAKCGQGLGLIQMHALLMGTVQGVCDELSVSASGLVTQALQEVVVVSAKVLPSQSTYPSRWRPMVALGSFLGK